jgi:predicted MFS family arabinose efflux permease
MQTVDNPLITSRTTKWTRRAQYLDPRRWRALALLCAASFMVVLDATIVLVALPSIRADIGFSEWGLEWVLSAYALTFGGVLLLGGGRPTCSGGVACS